MARDGWVFEEGVGEVATVLLGGAAPTGLFGNPSPIPRAKALGYSLAPFQGYGGVLLPGRGLTDIGFGTRGASHIPAPETGDFAILTVRVSHRLTPTNTTFRGFKTTCLDWQGTDR